MADPVLEFMMAMDNLLSRWKGAMDAAYESQPEYGREDDCPEHACLPEDWKIIRQAANTDIHGIILKLRNRLGEPLRSGGDSSDAPPSDMESAYEDGRDSGYDDGYSDGHTAGYDERAVEDEALKDELESKISDLENEMAGKVDELAIVDLDLKAAELVIKSMEERESGGASGE